MRQQPTPLRRVAYSATIIILLCLSTPAAAQVRFTDELWRDNQDVYTAILKHPFILGLVDGTLPKDTFAFYMMQDAHYLREFGRALSITSAKAPTAEWASTLSRDATESLASELQLHASVFKEYGVSAAAVAQHEPSPEAFGYMSFMVATAYGSTFEESIAGLLPCYWIYLEVGKELQKRGSTNPTYQKWIDNYSSPEYQKSVDRVIEIVNEAASQTSADRRMKMRENFRRAARYEWMFWDSAFNRRTWPPESPRTRN